MSGCAARQPVVNASEAHVGTVAGTGLAGIPKNSSEYITLIAHYYRAEMARMSGWRDRIDRTTNWAITVAGAMLSVSLSTPTSHHGVLLFAMILVLLFLVIEARRYRFFDVYRARVRLLERQYFARLFVPDGERVASRLASSPCASAHLSALAPKKIDPRRLKPQNYGGHSGRGGKSGEAAQKGRD